MKTSPAPQLRVGAAKIDISPVNGIQVGGDIGRFRPSTGVKDPIYARALVIEQGGKKFCIVMLDICSIDHPWSDEIRRRVHKLYGMPREAVMLHPSQNHAAPTIGNHFCRDSCKLISEDQEWLRGGDSRYNGVAADAIVKVIGQALENLTPVTMAAGRTIDGRVGFVRRYVLRDGTSQCQPEFCRSDISHVEGPMDPEVGVATFTAEDGRVVAALLHYTSHPCNGFWGTEIIPDWPGAWCNEMEAHFGGGCVPLVMNGLCGNVINYNYLDPEQPMEIDYKHLGRMLAQSTERALQSMRPIEPNAFQWTSEMLPLPYREIPADKLAWAKQLLKDHPTPQWKSEDRVTWDWVQAVGIIDCDEEQATVSHGQYEIQAMRLGDFALLSLQGEPFAETQLNIKAGSPFAFTQVAHLCNGYVCYIPTRRAMAGGSYEVMTGFWSRYTADAAEMIEQKTVEILKKLATQNSA